MKRLKNLFKFILSNQQIYILPTFLLNKMKKLLILFLALVLTLSVVSAVDGDVTDIIFMAPEADLDLELTDEELITFQKEMIIENLDMIQEGFNTENTEKIPEVVDYLFDGERVNINLEDNYTIGLVYEDSQIVELVEGGLENPSLEVEISDEVFNDFNNDELDATLALESGAISFEGVGFWNQLKFSILEILLSIMTVFT
jgi:hypothetical protein